jgi:hypothetical protein
MPAWLDGALPFLIKAALFGLIVLFFPRKKSKAQTDKSLQELNSQFKRFTLLSTPVTFLLISALALAFAYVFYELARLEFKNNKDAIVVVTPSYLSWVAGSVFLAAALGYKIMRWVSQKKLKDRFNDFMAFNNMKSGYDVYGLMEFLTPVLLLLSLVFVFLISGSSTVLYRDKMVVDFYFKLRPIEYKYSDIKAIEEFTGENRNIYYHITFNDGEVWSSKQNGFDDYWKDQQILDVLEDKVPDEVWE